MSDARLDGGDPEALVQIAARHRPVRPQRRAGPAPAPAAAASEPAPDGDGRPEKDAVLEVVEPRRGRVAAPAPAAAQARRARKAGKPQPMSTDTLAEGASRARRPRPLESRASVLARLGAWGVAACAAGLAVCALTLDGVDALPGPLKVSEVHIGFTGGPQLPPAEILRWVDGFSLHDQLAQPNAWVLEQLADYLRALPAVAEVSQVRLVHLPAAKDSVVRELDIEMRLRQPVMPTVLASGERRWLDADGRQLPGILPGPERRRPTVRGVEGASAESIQLAIQAWQRLEPLVESGLITDIVLGDLLDSRGAKGMVLYTRYGSRLVWGAPGEERYGVDVDTKARELVHTLRCQGDLSRVATINVRFGQPFYTLRE
jgi:hypothetical protein